MITESILAGILAILTPGSVFLIILFAIAFNNLKLSMNAYFKYSVIFALVIVTIYVGIAVYISESQLDILPQISFYSWDFILLNIIKVLLAIWILYSSIASSQIPLNETILKSSVVFFTGIIFAFSCFSNSMPFLGAMLVDTINTNSTNLIISLVTYGLTISIITSIILLLSIRLTIKFEGKNWWKTVKVIFGSLFLLGSLINVVSFLLNY